jgi:hypothetical protein
MTDKATKTEEEKYASLIRWNKVLAVLHLAQGIVILLISSDAAFQVTQAYQRFNPQTEALEPAVRSLFDVQLGYAVALFFFVSAFAHFYIGFLKPRKYTENLARGINKARWWEYSISASIMMVAIAMLSGAEDLSSLIMIFALTAVMNMTGLIMETHNQKSDKPNWLSFNVGSFAGLIPWLVVAIYFWAAETSPQLADGSEGSIPTFVYFIFVSIFIFFNCFAINMILQYKKVGKWADYLYGEKVYMILSLVAKSLLAWQIYAGTLQP